MKRPGARPDTWMPMFWGDYARDTGHLSATGHGAYLMLIKHYWCTGEPLPDDDRQLWRIACCDSPAAWKKLRPIIVEFFSIVDGVWRHKRVDEEIERAQANVDAKRHAAHMRWNNQTTSENDADALQEDVQRTSTSTSTSPSSKKESLGQNGHQKPPDPLALEFESWWPKCPRKVAKGAARRAYRTARAKASPEQLSAGITRYASAMAGKDPQYIAHPATWLNGERWNDEAGSSGPASGSFADTFPGL